MHIKERAAGMEKALPLIKSDGEPNDVRDNGRDLSQAAPVEDVVRKSRQTRSLTFKVTKTVFIVLGHGCLALFLEIAGPTLPDLKDHIHVDYEEISRVLVARSVGYFIGSISGGVIADKFPRHTELSLAASFLLGSLSTGIIPWAEVLWLSSLLFFFQGVAKGSINNAHNVLCLRIWKEKAPAPLHALHFGFGIGALLAPQLARPFISSREKNYVNETAINITLISLNGSSWNNSGMTPTSDISHFEYPYMIASSIAFLFVLIFIGFYIIDRLTMRKMSDDTSESKPSSSFLAILSPKNCAQGQTCFGIQMFILIFLYFVNAGGGEKAYSQFIFSYAVEKGPPKFTKDEGTYLQTIFRGCFLAGRFLSILLARWVSPNHLLPVQITGCMVSGIVLAASGYNGALVLWIFTGFYGFFVAPTYPGGLAWANQYLEISGLVCALASMGSALGGLSYYWVTGYMFEYYGPQTMMYVIGGGSCVFLVVFVVMQIIASRKGNRFSDIPKESNVVETLAGEPNDTKL